MQREQMVILLSFMEYLWTHKGFSLREKIGVAAQRRNLETWVVIRMGREMTDVHDFAWYFHGFPMNVSKIIGNAYSAFDI